MGDEITPPTLGGLDGFEVWDRSVHAPENKAVKDAFVSLRVGGVVGINLRCYAMWGEPEACEVMFDPERRRAADLMALHEHWSKRRIGGVVEPDPAIIG